MINKYLKPFLMLFVGALIFYSCTNSDKKSGTVDLSAVPGFTPEQIKQYDQIDTLYYSYLGVNSFPTNEGGFILAVWDPAKLVKTGADLNSISATTKKGRGPGESIGVGEPTIDDEKIYIYDQLQSKIIMLDRDDFSLIEEMVTEPYQTFRINRVYPEFSNGKLPVVLSKSQLIIDEMGQKLLITLDPETGDYGKSITLEGVEYAPLGELINGRSGSAMTVPYSDDQLIATIPQNKTLLLYDTRTDLIAEIDANFDTLRIIDINLPSELLSEEEKGRIKTERELNEDEWKQVEPYLPERKAKAADMIYADDRIWLKTTIAAEGDVWVVMNMEGEIEYKVNLPSNSYLTHVSEFHLGVRLDEINFALYENPIIEAQN